MVVDILSGDAAASMEIEGEVLKPIEVEECVRRQMGLSIGHDSVNQPATAAAAIAVNVLQRHSEPFDLHVVEDWRRLLLCRDGHASSGQSAPPPLAEEKRLELRTFLRWLDKSSREEGDEMPPLVRAGLAHLWFECIHPYPYGSGIIGRAIAARTLMSGMPGRGFLPLATIMLRNRNEYHMLLDRACRDHDATDWLLWFAAAVIEAVRENMARVKFHLAKTKLLESVQDRTTSRQKKVLLHLFKRGMENMPSGLSPIGYANLTGASIETAKRELIELSGMKALTKTVKGKHLRYYINVPPSPQKPVRLEDIA